LVFLLLLDNFRFLLAVLSSSESKKASSSSSSSFFFEADLFADADDAAIPPLESVTVAFAGVVMEDAVAGVELEDLAGVVALFSGVETTALLTGAEFSGGIPVDEDAVGVGTDPPDSAGAGAGESVGVVLRKKENKLG
jgi:hypothetical protein